MQHGPTVDIRNVTHAPEPRVPFKKIAQEILPEHYQLSLVLCGDARARRLHRIYRKPKRTGRKWYAPNVLSFPLEKYEGEIFLNVRNAEREAKTLGIRPKDRIAHLFIHGCFHLLGMKHGKAMVRHEERVLQKFGFDIV